jgi:hypothetical protein
MRALVNGGNRRHTFAQSEKLVSEGHWSADKTQIFCVPGNPMQAMYAVAGSSGTLAIFMRNAGPETDANEVFASLAEGDFKVASKTVLLRTLERVPVAGASLPGRLTGYVSSAVDSGKNSNASLWSVQ